MMKCRYCDNPITEKNINKSNIAAHSDICSSKDCQDIAKGACNKTLPCSHPCSGVKDEKKCLPCLK
jgi:E3 ubiquitin-protein ligase MYCBP2